MIHIAFNIDSKYVQYCGVTMVSVLKNTHSEPLCFHVIGDNLSDSDKAPLRTIALQYGAEISFYAPKPGVLDGFQIMKFKHRISLATYYRCLLADLLPNDIERVIYMDCDILVLKDLGEFYHIPLNDMAVAAVEDIGADESERYERLQYPMSNSYFNAGVLLVNLDYWRKHEVGKQCVELYRANPDHYIFNDQDLLNKVCNSARVLVDYKYNMQDAYYRPNPKLGKDWHQRHYNDLVCPVILHFTNRKPWDYDNMHPLRNMYYEYLNRSPWSKNAHNNSWNKKSRRFLYKLPYLFKIRKPKYIDLQY